MEARVALLGVGSWGFLSAWLALSMTCVSSVSSNAALPAPLVCFLHT